MGQSKTINKWRYVLVNTVNLLPKLATGFLRLLTCCSIWKVVETVMTYPTFTTPAFHYNILVAKCNLIIVHGRFTIVVYPIDDEKRMQWIMIDMVVRDCVKAIIHCYARRTVPFNWGSQQTESLHLWMPDYSTFHWPCISNSWLTSYIFVRLFGLFKIFEYQLICHGMTTSSLSFPSTSNSIHLSSVLTLTCTCATTLHLLLD